MKLLAILILLIPSASLGSDLVEAIQRLRPDAVWNLRGDTYDGLEWLDQVQEKPTRQEIEDALEPQAIENARIAAAKAKAKSLQEADTEQARLMRAIVKLTVDQLNVLRQREGLQALTYEQAKTAIENLVDGE